MTAITIGNSAGTSTEMITKIVRSALKREHALLERSLNKTEAHLRGYEQRYRFSSEIFFQRYQNGELDDRNDHIDWAGEYQIYLSIREQLDCLAEVTV